MGLTVYSSVGAASVLEYLSLNAFMFFLPEGSRKQGLNNTYTVITHEKTGLENK
jgi:hypothetical protein